MLFNTQVKNGLRVAITIPDNTGNGSTIAALLLAAGFDGTPTAIYIDPNAPGVGGASRGAFMVANARQGAAITGTDFTTHGEYVGAGAPYYMPIETDVNASVRSASAATVSALCIVMS